MTLSLAPRSLCGDGESTPPKEPSKTLSDEPKATSKDHKVASGDPKKEEKVKKKPEETKPTTKSPEKIQADQAQDSPSTNDQPTKPTEVPEGKERTDPRPRRAGKPKKSIAPKTFRMKTWRKNGLKSSSKTP